MIHLCSSQNIQTNTVNNSFASPTQKMSKLEKILNAFLPRSATGSHIHTENMQAPANTEYLSGVSAVNNIPSKRALERNLRAWVAGAPVDERKARKTASSEIRNWIYNKGTCGFRLNLSGLGLTSLPDNVFQHFPMLRELDISNNQLTTFNLSNCLQLRLLDAQSNNRLTDLKLPQSPELRHIDLSDTGIRWKDLPQHVMNMDGIIKPFNSYAERHLLIWLDAAPFGERIARDIAADKARECINNESRILDLSELRLTSLPDKVLQNIPSLRELNLRNNSLTNLDVSICMRLEKLNISSNLFETLDLSGCSELQHLQCRSNQLAVLNLSGCVQLTKIDLRGNNHPVYFILPQPSALKSVKLKGSDISFDNLQQELRNLEGVVIDIAPSDLNLLAWQAAAPANERIARGTVVDRIHECITSRGRSLDLSGLRLTSLPENVLQHIPSLRELNICNNAFTTLNLSDCVNVTNLDARSNNHLTELMLPMPIMALRLIELANTGICFEDLPQELRDRQDILIDSRPTHRTINGIRAARRVNQLNDNQSTHTDSIHRCASKNAARLKEINPNASIHNAYVSLLEWIDKLPTENAAIQNGYANDGYKNQAAKEWVQTPQHLQHVDQRSQISVKHFLAFFWLAVNDDNQRELCTPLRNAQESLRDALYEIRRGYNLNAKAGDNGGKAKNICAGGTFNKISEKLVSVVRDMSSQHVSPEIFTISLHASIRREVTDLLKNNRTALLEAFNANDGLLTTAIWDQIREKVRAEIYEEFKGENNIRKRSIEVFFNESTQFNGILEYLDVSPSTLVNPPAPSIPQPNAELRYSMGSTFQVLAMMAISVAAYYS